MPRRGQSKVHGKSVERDDAVQVTVVGVRVWMCDVPDNGVRVEERVRHTTKGAAKGGVVKGAAGAVSWEQCRSVIALLS